MLRRLLIALALALAPLSAAAQTTIYGLPAASSANGTDIFWISQGAYPSLTSRKLTVDQLKTYVNSGYGTAAGYNAGTSGSTLCLLTSACTWATNQVINWSDDGATGGPNLYLLRSSMSPAVSDILGQLAYDGYNLAGSRITYGVLRASILDPTAGTESGCLGLRTIYVGSLSTRLTLCQGVYLQGATGGDMGSGTFNANAYYVAGVSLFARTNAWSADNSFGGKLIANGNIVTSGGTTPAITSGGGTAPSIVGSNNAFRVTVGSSPTGSLVVTFANGGYAATPICQVTNNTTGTTLPVSTATTTITISGTMAASDRVVGMCQG